MVKYFLYIQTKGEVALKGNEILTVVEDGLETCRARRGPGTPWLIQRLVTPSSWFLGQMDKKEISETEAATILFEAEDEVSPLA